MKLPISPVCTKFDIFDIWLYSLQDWWRTVDEVSNYLLQESQEISIFVL